MSTATASVNRELILYSLVRAKFTEFCKSGAYHNNGQLPDDETLTGAADRAVFEVTGRRDAVLAGKLLSGS
jgi:hypothetical protein